MQQLLATVMQTQCCICKISRITRITSTRYSFDIHNLLHHHIYYHLTNPTKQNWREPWSTAIVSPKIKRTLLSVFLSFNVARKWCLESNLRIFSFFKRWSVAEENHLSIYLRRNTWKEQPWTSQQNIKLILVSVFFI